MVADSCLTSTMRVVWFEIKAQSWLFSFQENYSDLPARKHIFFNSSNIIIMLCTQTLYTLALELAFKDFEVINLFCSGSVNPDTLRAFAVLQWCEFPHKKLWRRERLWTQSVYLMYVFNVSLRMFSWRHTHLIPAFHRRHVTGSRTWYSTQLHILYFTVCWWRIFSPCLIVWWQHPTVSNQYFPSELSHHTVLCSAPKKSSHVC